MAAGQPEVSLPSQNDLSSADAAGIDVVADARLAVCEGFAGGFKTVLTANGGHQTTHQVGSIVVADDTQRCSNMAALGLKASASVQSLSEFTRAMTEDPSQKAAALEDKTVVFLNGLTRESTPVMAAEIMQSALALQDMADVRTFVLTTNLKVAADGLEALYHKAKSAGVVFAKFNADPPRIDQTEDGRITIHFTDDVSGQMIRLHPDVTVVDESILPSEVLQDLRRILDLAADEAGFLQTDNVHRWPVFTNRRGILAAGPARAVLMPAEITADAAAAAAAVLSMAERSEETRVTAGIKPGRCIRCLTCYRLCPYRSVQKSDRITISTEACEGCGICAAECPREAITLGESGAAFEREIEQFTARDASAGFWFPAFCCSRSAVPAGELAQSMGLIFPAALKIIEVPCAGALSVRHILAALTSGAAGVLVLSCHPGNCHSEQGNTLVRQRVELIREQLGRMGGNPARLQNYTLAANMAVEFADTVQRFEQELQDIK
jgi:heterodisulfide reductase subunit A-like polyferredoxin/coenzyme F420-reducing hydrogenase delta subunit